MKPSFILIATIGAGLALAQEGAPPSPPTPPNPSPTPADRPAPGTPPDSQRPRLQPDDQRPRFEQDRFRPEGERPRRGFDQPRFDRNRPMPEGGRQFSEGGRPSPEGQRPPRGEERRPEGGPRPPGDRAGHAVPPGERPPMPGGPGQLGQEFAKRIPQKPQPYLGLVTRHAGPDLTAQLRQPEGFGLVIEEVLPDSPAKNAGLERNDLLVRYEDQLLANPPQLEALVRRTGKDKEAAVTIMRGGAEQKITIKVGEKLLPEKRPYRQVNPGGFPQQQGLPGGYPGNPEPRRLRGDIEDHSGDDRQVTYVPQRARIERRDEQGRYELAPHEGTRTFVVLKADGAIAWRGPVETPEQRKSVPDEWRPKLDLLERAIPSEPAHHERPLPPDAL